MSTSPLIDSLVRNHEAFRGGRYHDEPVIWNVDDARQVEIDLRAQNKTLKDALDMWGILYNTPPLLTGDEWTEFEKVAIERTVTLLTELNHQ